MRILFIFVREAAPGACWTLLLETSSFVKGLSERQRGLVHAESRRGFISHGNADFPFKSFKPFGSFAPNRIDRVTMDHLTVFIYALEIARPVQSALLRFPVGRY